MAPADRGTFLHYRYYLLHLQSLCLMSASGHCYHYCYCCTVHSLHANDQWLETKNKMISCFIFFSLIFRSSHSLWASYFCSLTFIMPRTRINSWIKTGREYHLASWATIETPVLTSGVNQPVCPPPICYSNGGLFQLLQCYLYIHTWPSSPLQPETKVIICNGIHRNLWFSV